MHACGWHECNRGRPGETVFDGAKFFFIRLERVDSVLFGMLVKRCGKIGG